MKIIQALTILFVVILISCKNESGSNSAATTGNDTTRVAQPTTGSGDVSKFETLDHDFNVTPEGSRFFFKGFFGKSLVDAAMTFNKGTLHVKDGNITSGTFNLDMRTIEMISNRNDAIESLMKGPKVFDATKYPTGTITIEECNKAVNDQEATHIIKGKLELRGKTVPLSVRVRIDYKPKFITILSDQIIVKASDIDIKMSDPSQDNIYFSITINAELF